ncbi:TRAP transporter fused permease subunit [Pseudooceanicola sediminis]|uniref:TRAP transporter fused permease subunit n=1 Tax=Pseudooceanicola sediminis TaxID=2211117 RepID=A0A399IV85_9RHOB|nr:TRAP transporter fused permease subunit [Pseudooceanicola sediminis]KAA2311562.1 TRAP transporter fused permease subunit [Puniceibacterium sp. HSS470]RII37068.1 TRAP transporter fused permease subunit [Pseudooceanicola sediminis]|tara:strand:- start:10804 stop:12699 length:1896 start_codon:yes stop_codon:yes gene_type:complete
MRDLLQHGAIRNIAFVVGLGMVAFQIWLLFEPQQPLFERPIHLAFALVLLFLYKPLTTEALPQWARFCVDATLICASVAVLCYYLTGFERLTTRMENVSPIFSMDIFFGALFVFLLLEGSRRAVGWILVWVLLAFIAYAFWGNSLPGWLNFRGFGVEAATEIMTMTTAGVLGITTSTSVAFVFYFVLFGAFYGAVGGGQLFIDLAIRAAGRATGGTAKAAIIGSSLMGSISGSAVANVVSTGVFTIPLMKRTGVPAHRAAGIEAISSTGGQLMPPVMGVAAFIMAELLGIPYTQVALAGLIPAIAFYLALVLVVDLSARRDGVRALTMAELAEIPAILPRLHLILPPLVLIALLISGYSAAYSAVVASLACLVAPFLRRSTRIGVSELTEALREAPRQAAEVAVPIAAIGIVIAVAVQSNLALKFAGSLLSLSEGSVYASLMLAMLGCIIMGMGLPTVAAYIIGAVLFVPAIQDLGIDPLAAHFFIFYYCVLSMVTPPVALASFAAAAVGQASAVKTSLSAFGLSLVAFFVPFAFVFDPGVLGQGSMAQIAFSALSLLVSTALWAVAFGGWAGRPLGWATRLPIGLAGLVSVIAPTGTTLWLVGLLAGWILVVGIAALSRRRGDPVANPAE